MSPRKLVVLTAVVLVLFGFIILFERKMPTTADRERKGDLVWEIPENRIESIRLDNGNSQLELQRSNNAWKMVKPEAYPADATAVSDLVGQLASLKRAAPDVPGAKPEEYGVTTASTKVTLVWKDEGKDQKKLSRTLSIGKDMPGTDSTAAQTGQEIVFVPTSVATAARKSADDYKSKDVFTTSGFDAARLEIERGRGRLTLSKKNGVWWINQPINDIADGDAVQRIVSDLTGLKALTFLSAAERQDLPSLGLAPPLYRVTLADSKSAATTVEFGATRSDGNSIYARREGQVFTVSSSISEELSKEAVGFRDARLVHVDRPGVTSLTGQFGGQTYSLEHSADGWKSGGKALEDAPADALLSSILDLKSRSFAEVEKPPKGGTTATVTIKAPPADWTIQLSATRAEAQATVSGRPGAFALAENPIASLQASFEKAATAAKPTPVPIPTAAPTKAAVTTKK
jgi:Domain of unknown function (DUF4340)